MTQRHQVQQAIWFFLLGCLTVIMVSLYVANQLVVASSKKAGEMDAQPDTDSSKTTSQTNGHRVFFTFDDGPSEMTDAVLDLLSAHHVSATFFVIGKTEEQQVARYRRMVAEGHTIGLHSYSHRHEEIYASVDAYLADTRKLADLLYEVTAIKPRLYRMPEGGFTCPHGMKQEIIAHFSEEGYTHYLWDVDPQDAMGVTLSAEQLVTRVLAGAKARPDQDLIILMHDIPMNAALPAALPPLIAKFREQGYTFAALPQ